MKLKESKPSEKDVKYDDNLPNSPGKNNMIIQETAEEYASSGSSNSKQKAAPKLNINLTKIRSAESLTSSQSSDL